MLEYSSAREAIRSKLPELVKGAGFNRAPSRRELNDTELFERAQTAEEALLASVTKSLKDPAAVTKGFNPAFQQQFGLFLERSGMNLGMQQLTSQLNELLSAELGKNITLTSPLGTGLVPFDLVAPTRLIYPAYSPLRNRLPRVPGMGTSHRAKVLTAVSGSQTGQAVVDISIPELVTGSGSLNNWPLNLPPAGAQSAVDVNIPYKFFGVTEAVSWLAQFAGQGFEDAAALANLVLIQEAMMLEEYQILEATGTAVAVPGQATTTARTAGTGETALTGVTTNVYVRVTATNWFGETTASAVQTQAWAAGQVIDVTVSPVRGASQYNLYVGTGTTDPGVAGSRLMASGVGGLKYTLQGALPTTTATPPTADTGTGNANRYEGLLSILDGHGVTDAAVYPAGFQAGYVKNVGDTLNHTVVNNALQALWDGAGAFRANPAELVCEGGDAVRFANDIANNTALNYRLMIDQNEVAGMRGGAAISEYVNPVTRSVVAITVHPWQRQGVAYLLSYTLPQPWSNVSNVFENVMVQDMIGVSWPVIDASFRFSSFWYGALVCYAPQYNAVLKNLQVSNTTPYS